jgi:anti-sigma regulatory factor (Ser/Thr protein kinase)
MTSSALAERPRSPGSFRHEAFFYAGESQFVAGATDFIGAGVRADEPVLVVVSARKIDLLRQSLGALAPGVQFADMDDIGLNPARIIPAWTKFVAAHDGRPVRGIGEPIWAERNPAELVECQRHESLLNVAFAESPDFILLCPYDTDSLGPDALDEACHSHPFLSRDGSNWCSAEYPGADELAAPFSTPLPDPPASSLALSFHAGSLRRVRAVVGREASRAGYGAGRVADIVTAVNELASNSVRHAGGRGGLRVWKTNDAFLCEIADDGRIDDPLVGRSRPGVDELSGRGMWMVSQLCELVQVRDTPNGTTVRVHFRLAPVT